MKALSDVPTPPGIDYGTKVSDISVGRLCPSCVLEFWLITPLGPSSIIWEFPVHSRVRKPQILYLILVTNHEQLCVQWAFESDMRLPMHSYGNHDSQRIFFSTQILRGWCKCYTKFKVTSTMYIWIRYEIA